MKRYVVSIPVLARIDVEIEAENENRALLKAEADYDLQAVRELAVDSLYYKVDEIENLLVTNYKVEPLED